MTPDGTPEWDYDASATAGDLDGYVVPVDPYDLLHCDGCE